MRHLLAVLLCLAACASPAREPIRPVTPPSAVVAVQARHLDPQFWIAKQAGGTSPILDGAAIATQNADLLRRDASVRDISRLPPTLAGAQVREWIGMLSKPAGGPLFDERGGAVPKATLDAMLHNVDLDRIPASESTRYGLVTQRADLRTFPATLRVFSKRGETDIDRFQESALFPGTPVAIVHASRDGRWWFVVSPLYAAWIEQRFVAEGTADQVFGYARKAPYLVVTGASVRTVYTREQPAVSELPLDMGVRVPLLDRWPVDEPVNGQGTLAAYVIELPVRGADGSLRLVPALLPRSADVASDYLPLTRAGLLRQSFKFLGERYGWGHAYSGRDCSGFVSEVYRGFGVLLPRNTRDQGVTPVLDRLAFDENSGRAARLAAVRALQAGDLIYIPGHVMMVIGYDNGEPYVIHDSNGASVRGSDGAIRRLPLNGVSVTPLLPLLFNDKESYVDRMYSIQRLRPRAAP